MASLSDTTLFRLKPVLLGAVLWTLTGLLHGLRAQQVQVLVNVNPPYSAYLQDYAGAGQQVQVRLINTSGRTLPIRLQGSVTGDNGVSIRTQPNYRPPVPFTLGPGTTLLTRKDLEGLFDLNQILVEGIDKNRLYQGKPLPEGNYQVCVQVFDNRTSQPLSAGEPLGCSPFFSVKAIEPPILIAPFCDGDVLPTTPQATVFTWTPPAGILPTQVTYTLRLIELPLEQVDPNVFIDAVVLPVSGIEVKNLPTSTFLYGAQYLPLKPGKRYAWRVQAIDKTGKLNLLNDGKSPVCAFRYGETDTLKSVPMVKARRIQTAAGMTQFTFCGQTIQVKKVTNPSLDHFSGKGLLVMKSPVKLEAEVAFSELVIRPLKYASGKWALTTGFTDFTVIKGKLENKLTAKQAEKLKTDPHTGGTAGVNYQAIRLAADHTEIFDEAKNAHVIQPGGSEQAELQTGITWTSPIHVLQAIKLGGGGKKGAFSMQPAQALYDGDLMIQTAGEWHSIQTVGAESKLPPMLKIPFGQEQGGLLADLKGFQLSLKADSYFEIQNGVLKARLNGSLTVPTGRKDEAPLLIPFQETDGIAFNAHIEDVQQAVSVVKEQARIFLSFNQVNVQLGDLYEAADLPWPQWVKGISCPDVEFWARSGDYNNDKLTWTRFPINPVINRGQGFESTNGTRKDLNIGTLLEGFKGKVTGAVTVIKNSEFQVGHLVGQVYVPFVGSVGQVQIIIQKYGLDDAEVISFEKSERTLLKTPTGDRITVTATGGYFDEGLFYPDLSFSVFNESDPNRGLNAKDIRMDGIDVAITPKGELVSDYVSAKAEAFYSGSKQKTAYINGLDYHLARVLLQDAGGGKQCRLAFNGKLVLGEKITTKEQYQFEVFFDKPKTDEFAFTDAIPLPKGMPSIPTQKFPSTPGLNGNNNDGPVADDEAAAAENAGAAASYFLLRSAPASVMTLKANTIQGEFATGTAFYKALFTYYTDDPTYGNGFRAETNAQIFKPVQTTAKATVIAGKAQGVKYWFAGFKYESKDSPGIPLFLNLEAYGFEGRIYSHMKHTGDVHAINDDNYVPSPGTSFGMYAAMPIQSAADKGRLLWGKTAVEITFQGFAPSDVILRGDANIEQINGTGDATTSRMQGYAVIHLAIPEKTMMGHVYLSKGDFTAVCLTGSAHFYLGPSGFAASVGSPGDPVKATALCGALGNLTPSSTAYVALYATTGAIGGMEWIPANGIGIRAHLTATLLDLNTKDFFNTDPWAKLYVGSDADLDVMIRPSVDLKARMGTEISLYVGFGGYSYNLANVTETVQLTLPSFCLAYNKRICFPVLGGCNLIVGLSPTPYLRTNGGPGDMCFDDGSVEGPCEGALGWLMDGAQVVINAAGEVLDTAGNLLKDAGGAVVKGAKALGGAVADAFCSLFC